MSSSARSPFPEPGAGVYRLPPADAPGPCETPPINAPPGSVRPATAPPLQGAYVQLNDLLALRYRRAPDSRRAAARRSDPAGTRLSKLRGRGIDFSEVRLYQPGDDVRTIDWRVTARKNKPHTKLFREERERPALVVVDQTQSLFFGSRLRLKSVAAAELAAIAAWRSLSGDDRVGGLVIGNATTHSHKPLRSVKTVVRLLADLAASNQALTRTTRLASDGHFLDSLQQVRRLVHTGYRVLVISDFLTAADAWRDTLRALARHNELTAARIFDPLERQLPPAARYTVTDGAARWQFHAGNASLRQRYARRHQQQDAELASFCAAHGIRYLPCATDHPAGLEDWV